MNNRRILITSPSLNVQNNVSGIASLVSDIINNSKLNFIHLQLGSRDGSKKNLNWAAGQARIYLNIIFVSIFKRYDFVHLNMGLEKLSIVRDSLIFFIVNKLFRKKVILHIHGGYYLMNDCPNKLINFLLKKNFKYAEAIIVLSHLEKEILSKKYGEHLFYVFPNAVDTILANSLHERHSHSHIRFVFMARIVESKGIYTISESLQYLSANFNQFSLDIYGAGADLNEWLNRLKKIQGLQYHYNGVVGGKDKWNALKNADVLLLPSLYGEGMPIAMIEAMAVGCVVIVTDIASVKSVITNNVNGILLTESAPRQLAERMKDVIEGRIDVKAIGENAKKYVNDNLTLAGYITRLEQLYATL